MKKIISFIVLIILFSSIIVAQNLVPNGSFEEYKMLPKKQFTTSSNEIGNHLVNWFCPSPSSPDYFHKKSLAPNSKVPDLLFINSNFSHNDSLEIKISPISGDAFVGLLNVFSSAFSIRHGIPTFYSEYLRVKISKPLVKNYKYKAGFYYNNLASPSLKISDLGMLISQTDKLQIMDSSFVNYFGNSNLPQIKSQDLITTLNSWIKLQNNFKSIGGEEYITIGHFKQENSRFELDSSYAKFQSQGLGIFKNYFFIDSVMLFEIKGIVAQDTACFGEKVTFFSNASGGFWWGSDSYASTIYSTDSIYSFVADSSRWYYLFSSEGIDSSFLTVLKPEISLGLDTMICQGNSISLKAISTTSNIKWFDFLPQQIYTTNKEGYLWATAQEFNCKVVDSVFVKMNPVPNSLPEHTGQICSINENWYSIKISNENSCNWHDGDLSNNRTFTKDGIFKVIIKNQFGCILNDSISIADICQPIIYIPNAFVPDGVNKTFRPVTKFIDEIEWEIYNRNGEIMYSTKNLEDSWDGTYNGQLCPEGVYFYSIKYKGSTKNLSYTKSGNLTLLR